MGKMLKDDLGNRMKNYEKNVTPYLMPLVPAICRIDGRAFHLFTPEEISGLPLNHEARVNPELSFERRIISVFNPPKFSKIVNKLEFIFEGDDPHE